jgi:transmembrane sensor
MRWLVRLDAQRTPELVEQHDAWLAQSLRHRAMFAKQALAWRKMDALRRLRPLDPRRVDPDLLAKRKHRFGIRWASKLISRTWKRGKGVRHMRIGVAWTSRVLICLVIVGVVAVTLLGAGGIEDPAHSTRVGELSQVTLDDGTEAFLNTNTQIRIRFTADRREVFLDRGEAFFLVAHDASRPFEVTARGVTSRAVGTKFSVRLHDDDRVETVVAEGRVLVLRQSQVLGVPTSVRPIGRTLSAGERTLVGSRTASVGRLDTRHIEQRLRWTTGKVTFEGQALNDVVRELNRYTERPIVIRDRKAAHTTVGGGFDVESADEYATELVKFFGETVLARREPAPAR